MTKRQLIDRVGEQFPELSKKTINQSINLFFQMIRQELEQQKRVEIRGLGTFSVRHRQAHLSRNPQTGTPILIPSKYVPFFKPSVLLRNALKH